MDDERWNETNNKRQIVPWKKATKKVKWMIKDKKQSERDNENKRDNKNKRKHRR